MTRRDPYVNMLRTTIAVAAAGLGGADNIAVLPHTAALGLPDAFARRVARNTQLILLEESNLAKVADPAAGSGAIEDLTAKLCAAAWTLFQEIDAAGGAWAALEQGLIQREVAAVRAERQKAAARRKDALTGTSDYPNLARRAGARARCRAGRRAERKRRREADRAAAEHSPRRAVRGAARCLRRDAREDRRAAESVPRQSRHARPTSPRARPSRRISTRPAASRRSSNDGFKDQAAMVAAFKASGAKLACLCSSDKVYEARGRRRRQGARRPPAPSSHLAGRPGEHEAELAAGRRENLHVRGLRRAFDLAGGA